ncbi:MAG TPA: hypothetical protein VI457_01450, partial [Methylococcaceae bacterium]|nr:hypothetical protein [Methylococcaceae bacterium]
MLAKPPLRSIKTHWTAVLLACFLGPALLIGGLHYRFEYSATRDSRIRDVGAMADVRHETFRVWLHHAHDAGQGFLNTLSAFCRDSDTGFAACAKPPMERFAAIHRAVGVAL